MIPADLLDQLREKDPELWEEFLHTVIGYYDVDPIIQNDLEEPAQEAWLQYCLQEAIRARGRGYGIEYYMAPRMVGASVYVWGDGFDKKTLGAGYCTTEAEALMRAYLSALSGERI